MGEKNKKRSIVFFLVAKDVGVVSASWIGAWMLRHYSSDLFFSKDINPIDPYLQALPLIILLLLATNYGFGLYRRRREVSRLEELQQYLKAASLAALIVSSLAFAMKEADLGRSVVGIFVLLVSTLMLVGQVAIRRIEAALRRRGNGEVKVLIVGAGVTGVLAYGKICDHPEIGYRVVGFLDDDPSRQGLCIGHGKACVLGRIADLREIVAANDVDEVVFAVPELNHSHVLNLITENEDLKLDYRIVTDVFDVMAADARLDLVEDLPLINLPSRETRFRYEAAKRLFDFCVSASFILLFGWLIWPLIIIAIKLDSKGPAHFKQKRVGLHGEEFDIIKFRTMVVDAEKYSVAPSDPADPRITRVGRFLRKTSLDELPQLINILKGEMSLVGPRPEMPFIVAKYEKWQRRRFDALPGLTGLWQIYGRKDLPLDENIQYDFFYLKHRSFLFDLTILLKTIPAVLFSKGAY